LDGLAAVFLPVAIVVAAAVVKKRHAKFHGLFSLMYFML
jgi:hypothetical protein